MKYTAEILVDNTPDVFRKTFDNADFYKLVSVDVREERYMTTMKFLVGEYDVKLQFVTQDGVFSFSKTPLKVSCSCKAYFFYVFPYNKKAGCDCSAPRLKPYVKKTDKVPFNVMALPCCCKHLYHLLRELLFESVLKETVNNSLRQSFLNSVLLEKQDGAQIN